MAILVEKLKLMKRLVYDWERQMKATRCVELESIETSIVELFLLEPTGILTMEEASLLAKLKSCKEDILAFEASTLRIKSRAV